MNAIITHFIYRACFKDAVQTVEVRGSLELMSPGSTEPRETSEVDWTSEDEMLLGDRLRHTG